MVDDTPSSPQPMEDTPPSPQPMADTPPPTPQPTRVSRRNKTPTKKAAEGTPTRGAVINGVQFRSSVFMRAKFFISMPYKT